MNKPRSPDRFAIAAIHDAMALCNDVAGLYDKTSRRMPDQGLRNALADLADAHRRIIADLQTFVGEESAPAEAGHTVRGTLRLFAAEIERLLPVGEGRPDRLIGELVRMETRTVEEMRLIAARHDDDTVRAAIAQAMDALAVAQAGLDALRGEEPDPSQGD